MKDLKPYLTTASYAAYLTAAVAGTEFEIAWARNLMAFLTWVLGFLALVAVLSVIGIYLQVKEGNEHQDKLDKVAVKIKRHRRARNVFRWVIVATYAAAGSFMLAFIWCWYILAGAICLLIARGDLGGSGDKAPEPETPPPPATVEPLPTSTNGRKTVLL